MPRRAAPQTSDPHDPDEVIVSLRQRFDREARRTGSVATLHNRAVAEALGMHPTDQECLDLLDWTGPLCAGAIGSHLGLSSGAVTGLLDRLEGAGWVERQRDPADRRRVVVHLRSERLVEMGPLYAELARRIEAYRDALSIDELRAVVAFLSFANEVVEDATATARSRRHAVR